jgi:NDP-sugar pyrophosphorylase family protein
LAASGVEHVVVVLGQNGEKAQSFLRDGESFGVRVTYANQTSPGGTTAAMRAALGHLDRDEDAWVVFANAHLTADHLRPMVKAKGPALLVAAATRSHAQIVPTVRGDRLHGAARSVPVLGSTRVSTGVLRVPAAFLSQLDGPPGKEKELEIALAGAGHQVAVVAATEPWLAVIDPWDLLRLNEHVLDSLPRAGKKPHRNATGPVQVGADCHIADTATLIGPVTIGSGCSIGDYSVIGPYVSIRNNTVIGAHCEIRRSILNNNVMVDSRALVRGSILDDGVQLAPGFICHEETTPHGPLGCIIGRDAVMPVASRVASGTVVEPETNLRPAR